MLAPSISERRPLQPLLRFQRNEVPTRAAAGAASSIHAAATQPALRRFEQGRGSITIGGDTVACLTGGELNFTNNLEPVETIRDDGLLEGIDEGNPRASGSIQPPNRVPV